MEMNLSDFYDNRQLNSKFSIQLFRLNGIRYDLLLHHSPCGKNVVIVRRCCCRWAAALPTSFVKRNFRSSSSATNSRCKGVENFRFQIISSHITTHRLSECNISTWYSWSHTYQFRRIIDFLRLMNGDCVLRVPRNSLRYFEVKCFVPSLSLPLWFAPCFQFTSHFDDRQKTIKLT